MTVQPVEGTVILFRNSMGWVFLCFKLCHLLVQDDVSFVYFCFTYSIVKSNKLLHPLKNIRCKVCSSLTNRNYLRLFFSWFVGYEGRVGKGSFTTEFLLNWSVCKPLHCLFVQDWESTHSLNRSTETKFDTFSHLNKISSSRGIVGVP